MATILTLDEAAAHVREVVDGMPAEKLADLQLKQAAAENAVRLYLKSGWLVAWDDDPTTIPPVVKCAAETLLGLYWEHRGDDDSSASLFTETVYGALDLMLHQLRDPALA